MAAADVEKFRVVFDLCDAGVRMYGRHQDLTDLGYLISAASDADLDEARASTTYRIYNYLLGGKDNFGKRFTLTSRSRWSSPPSSTTAESP